jgi:dienelactone hydrolase
VKAAIAGVLCRQRTWRQTRRRERPDVPTRPGLRTVIDRLATLPYVEKERIGVIGIHVGAGYAANAAIHDRRVKAVGTASPVDTGNTRSACIRAESLKCRLI